jgi:hypothetical protein
MLYIAITLMHRQRMQQELEDNVHFNMMLYLTLSSFVLSPQLREWYINPRSTHWRDVTLFHPQFFSNADFQRSFRMSRTSFNTLHQLLQPHIQKQDTRFRKAIPSTIRLSIFLYHVCLGVGYTAISNQFAVGKSTVSKIVGEVGTAICKVMGRRLVRMPTAVEAQRSIEHWRKVTKGIPGIVACIDGSHIPITRPCASGNGYFNRKGYYSLNIQGTFVLVC